MADDGHEEMAVVAAPPPPAELPEIKLFGRWSCDDVQISDMSLQVSNVNQLHWLRAGYYLCRLACPSTDESFSLRSLTRLLFYKCDSFFFIFLGLLGRQGEIRQVPSSQRWTLRRKAFPQGSVPYR